MQNSNNNKIDSKIFKQLLSLAQADEGDQNFKKKLEGSGVQLMDNRMNQQHHEISSDAHTIEKN